MKTASKIYAVFFAVSIISIIISAYTSPVGDGDTWWHMAYGRAMASSCSLIPDHSAYTWTPASNDTIYCAWIPELLMYWSYNVGGMKLLSALRYLIPACFILLVMLFAKKRKLLFYPITAPLAAAALLAASSSSAQIKPDMFSFLFMSLIVFILYKVRADEDSSGRGFFFLPLVFVLWVNSHGAFIFGLPFAALFLAGDIINSKLNPAAVMGSTKRRNLAIAVFLSFASSAVTPYGWKYPLQLASELSGGSYDLGLRAIIAYRSSAGDPVSMALLGITVMLLLIAVFLFGRGRRIDAALFLTVIFYGVLYAVFQRTMFFWGPIFAFGALFAIDPDGGHVKFKKKPAVPLIAASLIALLFGAYSVYRAAAKPYDGGWFGLGNSYVNSEAETEYIAANLRDYRIGNVYNNGGYMLWRLAPETPIMIDPRYFPFAGWFQDYIGFASRGRVDAFLSKRPFDVINVLYTDRQLMRYFESAPEWKTAFYGPSGAVFVRREIKLSHSLPLPADNISNIRNIENARDACLFASGIGDLAGARAILMGMKKNYNGSKFEVITEGASASIKASELYRKGAVEGAFKLLVETGERSHVSKKLLADVTNSAVSYLWKSGDERSAIHWLSMNLGNDPFGLATVYNYGISSSWPSLGGDKNAPDKGDAKWKLQLRYFLYRSASLPEFDAWRAVAVKALDGKLASRPDLIDPRDFETAR